MRVGDGGDLLVASFKMYVIMYVDAIQPLLHFLLLAPNVIRLPILERGDEGEHGSAWGGVHLVMGANIFWTPIKSPLNLVMYMPFRIFAYSSNILKANYDLIDSMPA